MIKRSLIFSFFVSILSLSIVLISPFDVPVREEDKTYSPYRNEIDKLGIEIDTELSKLRTEILPSSELALKMEYRSRLIDKNNKWFDEEYRDYVRDTAPDFIAAWQKESRYLAPWIMILWGGLFYYFFRKEPVHYALFVLTFPLILTVMKAMPLLEFVLISFAVFIVWFWFLLNRTHSKQK